MKGIGLSRVASAAGVSVATVSNTINRPHMVSDSTRKRVEDAMRRLDFVPNRAAATLRSGYNRLLGVVVPELVNPFYAAITESIAVAASERGYAVALCVSHDDAAAELSHFEMLAEQRAAGAIVVPYSASGPRLRQLRMVGTHVVLVDRVVDEHDGCAVAVDDVAGGALAAHHLLETPGRGLTLVNGPTSIPQCRDRRRGVIEADTRAGAELIEFTSAQMTVDAGIEIGRRIADTDAPRRIFCTNDQLALGVVRGMRERGVSTPRDAVVVGYGDLALAVEGDIRLTSVAQPKERLGEEAVTKVLNEIEDAADHQHSTTVLAPHLVVRDSAPRGA